ncbi:hypothetical protein HWV00_20880 (plasmid) [Moritella sp. 24]|uniref:hypothetical protein n=1 Tax=Moritella sp. 24 TaxID=2746230 RepID=UPI001BA55396|nr:hypothetical protein [Moritella sp. 24]QUM78729.1 hypothetical protein HWV00_20880 [Moritella sp. 24]
MKFKNGKAAENVNNIGQLIALLQQLPPETAIEQEMSKSVDVVICNPQGCNAYVCFDEGFSRVNLKWVTFNVQEISESTRLHSRPMQ